MSRTVTFLLGAVAVTAAVARNVPNPVGKVIKLLEDLETTVTSEGQSEAGTYDAFSCFCKRETDSRGTDIISGRDTIKTESSEIAAKTATKEERENELKKREKNHEEWSAELAQVEADFKQASTEYTTKVADLSKAISSIESAIQSMETSKPASFLAVRQKIEQNIELAGVLNIIPEPKRAVLNSFLQMHVDPNDPVFKYHSQGIIDTLTGLLEDFRGWKNTLDAEWGKTLSTHTSTTRGLNDKINANSAAIATLKDTTIPALEGEIATARGNLVSLVDILKDDQAYMKDMTQLCETRANDWDQRSALRAEELSKLQEALQILRNDVQTRDTTVNQRAMFLDRTATKATVYRSGIAAHIATPSLLQETETKGRSHGLGANVEATASTAKQASASAFLRTEGERLKSTVLSSMAAHLQADPFGTVKTLIQKLIERLLKESTGEATKKGFCDEQLGQANKDRDYRWQDTIDLNLEITGLKLKEDELDSEIQMLTQALLKLRETLRLATEARSTEHVENTETIKTAKEGLDSIQEAILVLKVFYKQAAKATVLLQASPVDGVDGDTTGAGFEGAYTGKQDSSKAIIGLLMVIESDFDRTVRVTEEQEAKAHADFVEFDRVSKADISGKTEKKGLDEEDLVTTRDTIMAKMQYLQSAQDLLDTALRVLEDLKPTCVDTGMSYADRVSKREEEIEALGRALCILTPEDSDERTGNCARGSQTVQTGQSVQR